MLGGHAAQFLRVLRNVPGIAAGTEEAEPAAESVPRSSKIGPAALVHLQEAGLAASDVTPTGPGGIVTKGDVLAAIAKGVKPGKAAPKKDDTSQQASAERTADKGGDQKPDAAKQAKSSAQPPPAADTARAPRSGEAPAPQPQRSTEERKRSPDSKLKGILAEKMLEQGQRIPDSWLLDWVGASKRKARADSA